MGRPRGWAVVAGQELRDLWIAGRGLPLLIGFSALIGVITYLSATNEQLNFLEQHEAVNLTIQVAVAVGALLSLLAAADAISGERERGTLEILLLTPVPRRDLALGKLVAALSLWFAAIVLTVPYVWFLGHGVGAVDDALGTGFVVGTLLALGLAAFGLIVSAASASNRASLSVALFVLLALFAPTLLPTGAQNGWAGELLLRVNPITAGLHYIGKVVVDRHSLTEDASWLVSPIVAAVVIVALVAVVTPRLMTLRAGSAG
jgi:ABC-2 type transport system permease protein